MEAYAGNGTEDTGSHTGGAAVPSGLMEELKETLAEYITRTLGIHPEKRICCPVNLRGLMGFMEREYGVYDGFYYTLGRNWFRREKMGLHSRPEKEFPEAKQLLDSTAAGSESAAAAVGYGNNPKYFTKVFKKYTGYTPTEYKQLYGRRV